MKQFIVLLAVLPIMLLFMMQIAYEQKNISNINHIQAIVYSAKEDAKQAGYFSQPHKDQISQELLALPGVEEVTVTSSQDSPQERYSLGSNRFIDYRIELVLTNVMAGGGTIIEKEKNRYTYVLEGYTASEFLQPGE
jgi:hypothetical protein